MLGVGICNRREWGDLRLVLKGEWKIEYRGYFRELHFHSYMGASIISCARNRLYSHTDPWHSPALRNLQGGPFSNPEPDVTMGWGLGFRLGSWP